MRPWAKGISVESVASAQIFQETDEVKGRVALDATPAHLTAVHLQGFQPSSVA